LKRQGRVKFAVPAVYSRESKAYRIVCAILDKIKADNELTVLSR